MRLPFRLYELQLNPVSPKKKTIHLRDSLSYFLFCHFADAQHQHIRQLVIRPIELFVAGYINGH